MSYSAATFANLANWPNADVPSMALITELIPELCGVPYDYVLRDDPAAMDLLTTTNLSANKICHEVGMDNENYFYRLFKKYTGFTSNEYRKNMIVS